MSKGIWRVNEDGDFVCIARILNVAGTLVTQATVTSIALTVSQQATNDDTTADSEATPYTATPVVASTIYDTAQTSATLWPSDEHPDGYNFLYVVPAAGVPVGGVYYNAEFTLTMANGGTIQVPFRGIYAEPLLKS
jgi:hypothetical protein